MYPVYTDLDYTDEMNAYTIDKQLHDDIIRLESYQYTLYMMPDENGIIQESDQPKKKSLVRRIWEWIKDQLRKLVTLVKWIGSKIKKLFSKKKVSIDQIIENCHLQPKKRHIREAFQESDDKIHESVIHFPATKGSVFSETDIKVAAKRLYTKVINNEFVLSAPGIEDVGTFEGPPKLNKWIYHYAAACAVMDVDKWYELFFDTVDKLVYKEDLGELVDIEDGFIDNVNELYDGLYKDRSMRTKYIDHDFAFHLKDFTNFQQDLYRATSSIDHVQVVDGISDELLKALNRFADIITSISFGMNEMNRTIQGMYIIDEKFIGAVNEANQLDEFIFQCIKDGVPQKFIAYNTWLLLDESWKIEDKVFYTNQIKPKWGQTRTVFHLPDFEYVAKIAMSGIGIRCNVNEIDITKEYKKRNLEDVLAYVEEYTKHATVIFPHALTPFKTPNDGDLFLITDQLSDLYWDYPDLPNISDDLKLDNIGFSTDYKLVCIDYGSTPIRKK